MSDEATTPQTEPTQKPEKRPLSATARLAIGVAVTLVLLLLVSWGGNHRAEAMRREAFAQGVDALSAGIGSVVLERDQPKLERLAQTVREAGQYVSVTFADKDGRVIASTDKNLPGTTLEGLRDQKTDGGRLFTAQVKRTKDGLQATRGVYVAGPRVEGNSLLVWLRVVAKP